MMILTYHDTYKLQGLQPVIPFNISASEVNCTLSFFAKRELSMYFCRFDHAFFLRGIVLLLIAYSATNQTMTVLYTSRKNVLKFTKLCTELELRMKMTKSVTSEIQVCSLC